MGAKAPQARAGAVNGLNLCEGHARKSAIIWPVVTYHLHLINTHADADDCEGHLLASLDEARAMAVDGIRGYLSHEVSGGQLDLRGRIDIEDDDGAVLASVRFDEVIEIVRG